MQLLFFRAMCYQQRKNCLSMEKPDEPTALTYSASMGSISSKISSIICPSSPPHTQVPKEKEIVRFFMIGTGAAGKTTVIRQLKCLCKERPKNYKTYDNEWNLIPPENIFSEVELMHYRKIIRINITYAVYNLLQQTIQWGHDCSAVESAQTLIQMVERADLEGRGKFNMNIPLTLGKDLVEVLIDPNVANTLKNHDKMARIWHLEDGTLHFLTEEHIKRLFDDEAELTMSDIVHSRYPTTDSQDFRFSISNMKIQIHDMGGQPTELAKLPEFINHWVAQDREGYKNFVLFVTSMADFNVPDEDEPTKTALERSVRILEIILREDIVRRCGLLIFFNKQDRFDDIVTYLQRTKEGRMEIAKFLGHTMNEKDKVKLSDGQCDMDALYNALADKFDDVIKKQRKETYGRGVYMRFTQAVDSKIMADIFKVIKNEIIKNFIDTGGWIA